MTAASLLERQWYNPLQIFPGDDQHINDNISIAEFKLLLCMCLHLKPPSTAVQVFFAYNGKYSQLPHEIGGVKSLSIGLLMQIHAGLHYLCIAALTA